MATRAGRYAHGGLDCVGLLRWPAVVHGITKYDDSSYGSDEVESGRLQAVLDEHMIRLPSIKKAKPGDAILFRVLHAPQHVGILLGTHFIHAMCNKSGAGKVVLTPFRPPWSSPRRAIAAYQYPGVE